MVEGIFIHDPELCEGEFCPFHNPSDHPLKDAPYFVRFDRPAYATRDGKRVPVGYLTERICEHGVGHPDPDSMDYLVSIGCDEEESVHGCDGCCSGITFDA